MLSKFLEADALKSILKRVIEIEETRLAAEYRNVPEEGKMRQQVDIDKAHFMDKISAVMPEVGAILK